MKKNKTQQTQNYSNSNTYGWQTPPDTADVAALRNFKFTADPSIGYNFGSARNQVANSFNDPLGGVYSSQQRDAILRSSLSDLAMQESQAKSEASQALQGQEFAQRAAVAGMTAPRLTQTGSSGNSSGTVVQSSPMWPELISAGATGVAA